MSPRWIVGFAAWASVLAIGVASASSLGGLTAESLEAWNQSGTPSTPTILSCDAFALAAPTGSALASRPVQLAAKCGSATWSVHSGTWTIAGGRLNPGDGNATATVSAGTTDVSAQATVVSANGNNRVAGIAINHTGATRIYLAGVLSGPGTVQLSLVNGASVTTLASATATITASTVVRITRNGTAVSVSVNGVLRISHTLSAGQVATLAGGTQTGLYFDSGNQIRFADIVATTPASP